MVMPKCGASRAKYRGENKTLTSSKKIKRGAFLKYRMTFSLYRENSRKRQFRGKLRNCEFHRGKPQDLQRGVKRSKGRKLLDEQLKYFLDDQA